MPPISEQIKSVHPIVIDGMQLIFDRYSESDNMSWDDYHFLHRVLSRVHQKTLTEVEKSNDIG